MNNFIVGQVTPTMMKKITFGTFVFFGVGYHCCFANIVVVVYHGSKFAVLLVRRCLVHRILGA